ncbi:aspartate aminotransferase [Fusibacter sp. 3D3]|nr:aspartate aminotransferase [Fusibacter sp. 3D3]
MDREGIQYWNAVLERRSGEDALLYTIPTFQNPTGVVMSEMRRKELFKFCMDNRLPIIEDDAYGDIWLDEEPPRSLKSMDENGMVLYLGTVSKVLAPGLRIGWIVGAESVVERLGDVKMQMDYGASSVSQWIVKAVLSSPQYDLYLEGMRESLKSRRNLMIEALEKYFKSIADWQIPQGGFYIWLNLKHNVAMDQLFHLALKERILLNLGSIYDFRKNNALRLSYSYIDEEEIMVSIEKLSQVVQRLQS